MNCFCDQISSIELAGIPAGLDTLPRQIAGFPEFRRALLADIRNHAALHGWSARQEDDPGVMLLEMWAYVCDIVSFYDEVIANEQYLRSARLRPSVRKLVELLGYIPRPAVASTVWLTLQADGLQAVTVPAGTAFRSRGFDGQAPQVFELDDKAVIHPFSNRWTALPQRPDTIGDGAAGNTVLDGFLLQREEVKLKKQELVLVSFGSSRKVVSVVKREETAGDDGERYIRIATAPSITVPSATRLDQIELHTPVQSVGLWTTGARQAVYQKALVLNGLYRQFRPGQMILVGKDGHYRWYFLSKVTDVLMVVTDEQSGSIKDSEDKSVTLTVPPFEAPATKLVLDADLNDSQRKAGDPEEWSQGDADRLTVYYGMVEVGELTRQKATAASSGSVLTVSTPTGGKPEAPSEEQQVPGTFVLQDRNGNAVIGTGPIDYTSAELDLQTQPWSQPLQHPVSVFGNVVRASRGETVEGEVLGSGDAGRKNQTFTLKKKPLTYRSAATSDDVRGVVSTLTVWVGGIEWKEVATFYGKGAEEEVYILRQNDDQETLVIFGDGVRGSRLPSGKDNVVASYRFGAGAAQPPASAITQLARPVQGVKTVSNPFAATGGSDAEEPEGIRDYGPASALILGRAVSLPDLVAVAAGLSGVTAAHGEWRWHETRQSAVAQLWYAGTAEASFVLSGLRSVSDPAVSLAVEPAESELRKLSFEVVIDQQRYIEEEVIRNIRKLLLDGDDALLGIKQLGIGRPFYRSRLFAAILSVPGTLSVTSMAVTDASGNELPFETIGMTPGKGCYFDFAGGGLSINGKEQ